MKCARPLFAWEAIAGSELVFNERNGKPGSGRELPCGKCTACRMNKSRDNSIRVINEVQSSIKSCVATVTFDDDHVPDNISEIRPFVKSFKERCTRRGINPRSQWLLEYGGQFDRPHAHVVFFCEDFKPVGRFSFDALPERSSGYSSKYVSEVFEELWPWGNVQLDVCSPAACRYIAGHNQGKLEKRLRPDGSKSEILIPARPAIGLAHARKFADDLNRTFCSVIQGKQTAVPKAYRKYEPDLFKPLIDHCREYAKERSTGDLWDGRVATGDEREARAALQVAQMAAAKAWHSGCKH